MLCSCLAMPYNARKYTVKQGTVLEARSAPRAKRRYALYSSCTLPSYLVLVVKISCVWIDFAKTEKHRRSGVCTQGHKSEERSTRTDKPPQRHQDRTTTGGQNTHLARHSTHSQPQTTPTRHTPAQQQKQQQQQPSHHHPETGSRANPRQQKHSEANTHTSRPQRPTGHQPQTSTPPRDPPHPRRAAALYQDL